ncbi:Di-copper centre-containing protein [Xylariomycetidae sp. FL2044]|nr:Di-copper centre-containing protein [Xylariomycetidae sp. FL2044]
MRFSTAAQALCGALTVSALTIPGDRRAKRVQLVDLAEFGSFPTISPEQAKADAEESPAVQTDADDVAIDNVKVASEESDVSQAANSSATTAAAGTCDRNNPAYRYEWANYPDSDRQAFVAAIRCLMDAPSANTFPGSTNRYEDLVSVHQQMTGSIHMLAQFLPWHRYYVSVFESLLRDECAFDRPMPWWDETINSGNFAASDIFSDAYFGPLPAKTADGQGTCIETGAFGGVMLHIGPGSGFTEHCLSRAVDESLTATVSASFVSDCNSRTAYNDFRGCLELGPHAYGHNGVGAVMAEVSASPGDPIFFMHHLFVDRTFRIWQNADPARTTTIDGCQDGNDPCTPITMDYVLSSNGLRPDTTVGAVMDTLGDALCYRYDR